MTECGRLESNRVALGQERTPAYGDALALARKLEAERDALREYYEAVQTHPVNYSAGNIERVMAAIKAIKDIDAALAKEQSNGL